MTKSSFQDIVPPEEKRSIRNIPLPRANKPKPINEVVGHSDTPIPPSRPALRYKDPRQPRGRSPWLIFAIAIILLLAIVYAGFSFFEGATLKITPKQAAVNITLLSSASKDSSLPLRFNLITVENQTSKTVLASSSASIKQKAQGEITIYNNFSTSPQTLVATTRFETTNGLIYRIPTTVVVPGQTTVNGKVTPGSISATVVADQPGDSYNVSQADFTIPGFKSDTARYAGFYARSKAAIKGGFVGIAPQLSATDRQSAKSSLDTELKTKLMEQAASQIPSDFVLYPDGISIQYGSLPDSNATSSGGANSQSLTLNEKGTLYGIIFSKADLASYIATKTVTGFDPTKNKVAIPGIQNIGFTLQNKSAWSATSTNTINFNLTGSSTIVWQFDQNALKKDLSAKNKNDIQGVLASKYPSIERIQVLIRPFWQNTLPKDTSKILVDILEN